MWWTNFALQTSCTVDEIIHLKSLGHISRKQVVIKPWNLRSTESIKTRGSTKPHHGQLPLFSLSPQDKLNSETLVAWLLLKALRFNVAKRSFFRMPTSKCLVWILEAERFNQIGQLLIWSWSHDQPNLPPKNTKDVHHQQSFGISIIYHTYQVICSPNVHIERDDLKKKGNWIIFQPLIFQGG